jgi:hypothetical protein
MTTIAAEPVDNLPFAALDLENNSAADSGDGACCEVFSDHTRSAYSWNG